jgi:hypothetical protein
MVSLFGLGRVIPYKGKKSRDISSRQRAFGDLFTAIEVVCGPLLQLESSDRWQLLRDKVTGAARQVDLDTVEDEVDAVFCAYLAWLWAHDAGAMTVLGNVESGYIVTPVPPSLDDDGAAFRLDPEAGTIKFANGAQGRRPSADDTVAAPYRTGGGAAGAVEQPSGGTRTDLHGPAGPIGE